MNLVILSNGRILLATFTGQTTVSRYTSKIHTEYTPQRDIAQIVLSVSPKTASASIPVKCMYTLMRVHNSCGIETSVTGGRDRFPCEIYRFRVPMAWWSLLVTVITTDYYVCLQPDGAVRVGHGSGPSMGQVGSGRIQSTESDRTIFAACYDNKI